MQDYKKLMIWQKGMELVRRIYRHTAKLPKTELYGLTSQIRRASVSIPWNIAEGSSRSSKKDYSRFLEIAMGSCFELETCLLITLELEMLEAEKVNPMLELVEEVKKMIYSFRTRVGE